MAIPLPCEITLTNPLQKNRVPMVATIDGIPILVTNNPFTNPANIPSAAERVKAIKKFPSVPVNSIPKVSEVMPTMDGKERSISPRVTTNVADIAMIPKKAWIA